ncbi:DUF4350 domain-containing protein [sulfur-oxidizing endosymbiont of Gigantopelta aegis]|uniref:DUF4350 domain-containing protein n=1 Tax=sulfur-oxidizing endosymbiont of Gigantopelta aegis TaxID=2794934 RepID=UPI0018DD79A4|nr:DUF4350 domain-containing protein [sulfur-oxidizing endosymbiont of Gigantopelta aegis]
MNKSTQILLTLLLLIISLATGYWFYNNFEWLDEEKEVGFQGIAQTNNLLAAEFFLRKMGIDVQQVNGLVAFRDLPSAQHSILITTQRETINKELSKNLLAWVREGGHLIVEARKTTEPEEDDLLSQWQISAQAIEAQEGQEDKGQAIDDAVKSILQQNDTEAEDIPVAVQLSNKTMIDVNFPYDLSLYKESSDTPLSWLVHDKSAAYIMQLSLGQGLLTVLNSTKIFNNEQIAQFDHARLLHYLTQYNGHDVGVWLIRVDDMPALWQWLWDYAWPAMLSLSLLFLIWLWRAPLRFGPRFSDKAIERRRLLEHIQASGHYRWHHEQSGYLLAQVQADLWDHLQRSHPTIHRENPALAYRKLADITAIQIELIEQALTPVDSMSEQEFINHIKVMEKIRQHL